MKVLFANFGVIPPIIAFALIMALVYAVFAPREVDKQTAVVEKVEPVRTLDQSFAALHRAAPKSDQICYDEPRNAWYLHWPDGLPEGYYKGWRYMDNVEFYYLSKNNSWFITDAAFKKVVEVYPDVAGLDCK